MRYAKNVDYRNTQAQRNWSGFQGGSSGSARLGSRPGTYKPVARPAPFNDNYVLSKRKYTVLPEFREFGLKKPPVPLAAPIVRPIGLDVPAGFGFGKAIAFITLAETLDNIVAGRAQAIGLAPPNGFWKKTHGDYSYVDFQAYPMAGFDYAYPGAISFQALPAPVSPSSVIPDGVTEWGLWRHHNDLGFDRWAQQARWEKTTESEATNYDGVASAAQVPAALPLWGVTPPLLFPKQFPEVIPRSAPRIAEGPMLERSMANSPKTRPEPKFQRAPTRPREREGKWIGTLAGGSVAGRVVGAVTEFADFVGAIFKTVPDDIVMQAKLKKWAGQKARGERLSGLSIIEKGQIIYDNWDKLDYTSIPAELIKEHVEDKFFGQLGKTAGKARRNLYDPKTGRDLGPGGRGFQSGWGL